MKKNLIITLLLLFTLTNVFSQALLYQDNMTGDNSINGLQARGFVVSTLSTGLPGMMPIWYQGDPSVFPSYSGNDSDYVMSGFNTIDLFGEIDHWLILPSLNLDAGDSLVFHCNAPLASPYPDSIKVMYSPVGDTLPGAASWIELDYFLVNPTGSWQRKAYSAPQPGSNARFAIRYYIVEGGQAGVNSDAIGIDDIEIVAGDFNLITGKVYFDQNSNAAYDAGDILVPGKKVTETTTGNFRYTNAAGQYFLGLVDTGSYNVSMTGLNNFNATPFYHTVNFPGINLISANNDFALQAPVPVNDLCVTITPLGNFRPGMTGIYQITYENNGSTTLTPTIVLENDTNLNFQSASVNPSTIIGDTIIWTLPPIAPFQSSSINIFFTVAIVPIGTALNSAVRIEPIANDANTYCNYSSSGITVTGSYDPNDILINEDTLYTNQINNSTILEYIIRFQNTGNDTAFTVRIENPISTLLDVNSIEILASSNPVVSSFNTLNRNMTFTFNNILLPDSFINEPESHGFVHYSIKPVNGISAGSIILNNAGIYFDYNSPVMTNTATTAILFPTGLDQNYANNPVSIYPNPASDFIYINAGTFIPLRYQIIDVTGKLITENNFNNNQIIDIRTLSKGLYILSLINDSENKMMRIEKK